MKTVLITGCSSGYGLATARQFHAQGWRVVATMRTPREDVLPRSDRLRVVALDVTNPESIGAAGRGERAHRRARQQRGHRASGGVRGHADDHGARDVRDEHLRRDGDDTSRTAPVPRAQVRRDRERHVERDPGADAAGRGLHGEQNRHRRVHGVARVRARGVQRAGEARGARLRSEAPASRTMGGRAWKG